MVVLGTANMLLNQRFSKNRLGLLHKIEVVQEEE